MRDCSGCLPAGQVRSSRVGRSPASRGTDAPAVLAVACGGAGVATGASWFTSAAAAAASATSSDLEPSAQCLLMLALHRPRRSSF